MLYCMRTHAVGRTCSGGHGWEQGRGGALTAGDGLFFFRLSIFVNTMAKGICVALIAC